MKTYRVFVTRHYIDSEWFDIEAESKTDRAIQQAKQALTMADGCA